MIGDWLITMPNQDVMWLPPWDKCCVCLRANVRYGFDDPTLWPQVYVVEYCHLGAILRQPEDYNDPFNIMWWNLMRDDFVFSPNSLVNGIGLLVKEKCEIFDTCRRQLLKRVDEYKATAASPHYYLLSITRAMNHAGIRLGCLAALLIETKFGITEFQHYYLEAVALLDYLQVYKP